MPIKDFSILAELGKGAYSSVYKVERILDQQYYALKKVKLQNLSQKQLQNALTQVRILASINHPNIVGYKQAFLQGKNLCIIMQYADNGDLYHGIVQHKKRGKYFEQNQIWKVMIQSVRGLRKLHSMKIFHRDMKSANIFLNKLGQAKLGDMNVSKIAKEGLLYTQTGTPYYASPQVWNEKPYDSKSDIWSLGVVIYEMSALNVPFQAQDMQCLANAITKGKFPPIPAVYSQQLSKVISLMLQQNPNKRPSADKLCRSSLFKRKAKQLGLQQFCDLQNEDLLKTIRIPKKLHYLTDQLPQSKYLLKQKNGNVSLSINKRRGASQSDRYNSVKTNSNINDGLPKLDKILKYHQQIIQNNHQNLNKNYYKRNSINQGSYKHTRQYQPTTIEHQKQSLNLKPRLLDNHKSLDQLQVISRDRVNQVRKMNRKQILQKDLRKIYEGKHQVYARNQY